MRAAFDIMKTVFMQNVTAGKETLVEMAEVAGIIKSKYLSRLGKILKSLPVNNQMLVAAIFACAQADHRELFKYKEVETHKDHLVDIRQADLDALSATAGKTGVQRLLRGTEHAGVLRSAQGRERHQGASWSHVQGKPGGNHVGVDEGVGNRVGAEARAERNRLLQGASDLARRVRQRVIN